MINYLHKQMGPASKYLLRDSAYPQADRAYPPYDSACCDGLKSSMFRSRQVEAHKGGKDDNQED